MVDNASDNAAVQLQCLELAVRDGFSQKDSLWQVYTRNLTMLLEAQKKRLTEGGLMSEREVQVTMKLCEWALQVPRSVLKTPLAKFHH